MPSRVLAAILCAVVSVDVGAQMDRVTITSCAHADSLLGPLRDDTKGEVFRTHRGTPDTTFYRTGPFIADPKPHFRFLIHTDVPIPGVLPDAQGYVILKGKLADQLTKSPDEPRVWIQLDDAPLHPLPIVARGKFEGHARSETQLPVSVGFQSSDLIAIARAKRTMVRVEDFDVRFSAATRRDVRALIRANVCVTPAEIASTPPTGPADTSKVYFEFQVDTQVRHIRKDLELKYPEDLKARNIEGSVLVQFIVDTLGRIEMTTFKVLKTDHVNFALAVLNFLEGARYHPAKKNGRVVRQLVQQPFNFTLRR